MPEFCFRSRRLWAESISERILTQGLSFVQGGERKIVVTLSLLAVIYKCDQIMENQKSFPQVHNLQRARKNRTFSKQSLEKKVVRNAGNQFLTRYGKIVRKVVRLHKMISSFSIAVCDLKRFL